MYCGAKATAHAAALQTGAGTRYNLRRRPGQQHRNAAASDIFYGMEMVPLDPADVDMFHGMEMVPHDHSQ